jgi:hypothetical protein
MKVACKLAFVAAIFLLAAGCATSGPKFTEISSTMDALPSDTGRIYIYRSAVVGMAIQPEVRLNGEVVGRAVPMGFFYLDEKPGNYELETTTEVTRKLSLTLEQGQKRYVRLNISLGFLVGHVYPELVDDDVAQREIKDCRYLGR